MMSEKVSIIDATNLILGRMASIVAKRALEGERIVIINAEKAIVSGGRTSIVENAKHSLRTRTLGSLEKGPTHPRRPDRYVKRAIRGMLPKKKHSGKEALKRIKVYTGIPEEFRGKQSQRISEAESSKLRCRYLTIQELTKEIGGTGGL